MPWGAKLKGGDALAGKLNGMRPLGGDDVAIRALTAAGQPIAEAARANVRERTDRLKDSIGVGTQLSPHQASVAPHDGKTHVYVGAGALVEAITEEFGTIHEAPHPFLRPAWDSQQRAALKAATDVYAGECSRLAGA